MDWEKLFAPHILERGYNYYCENAVENMYILNDVINADVIGTEDYEVRIYLSNGEVTDMYCSCPYATDGNNCKHMAAVLYEWSENDSDEEEDNAVFKPEHTTNTYNKKLAEAEKLVDEAEADVVRSFLASVLADDEKLLLRFNNTVHKQVTKEDIKKYFRQIDSIADRCLGRDYYISYEEAYDFISELEEILDEDVQRMIDNGNYFSAFEVMNHIFLLIGDVDMDDSDGGISMIADNIYQLWLELLDKVTPEEKKRMFDWFISNTDGTVIDFLEDYIEQIVMEAFNEKEYEQLKLDYIEDMIEKSEEDTSWGREYSLGKWVSRYLNLLEEQNATEEQIEEVCKRYWKNSYVRNYYIDKCMEKKEYNRLLKILDECILLDEQHKGLVSKYNKKKKEIYLLQGNKSAYIEQLWKLVLEYDAGNLDLYRELKRQYSTDEWLVKREEIFKRLPASAQIERLYMEEKLYDRLLKYVLNSPGLGALNEYEKVLKKEYPEQILEKYKNEVNKMAANTGSRKQYSYLVSLLRKMKKMKGGAKVVEQIVEDWKEKYKKRPAMMDELRKL